MEDDSDSFSVGQLVFDGCWGGKRVEEKVYVMVLYFTNYIINYFVWVMITDQINELINDQVSQKAGNFIIISVTFYTNLLCNLKGWNNIFTKFPRFFKLFVKNANNIPSF